MADGDSNDEWLAVIARSLAFLCLAEADIRDKDLATQARFLQNLGVPRRDSANLLGTSEESIRVLLHRSNKKKGGSKRGAKKAR